MEIPISDVKSICSLDPKEETLDYICNLITSISIYDDYEAEIIKEIKFS